MGSDLMRTVYVRAFMRLPLGKQGENEAVQVVWPGIVDEFRELYGSGAFTLTAKRCGDAEAYPVAVSTEGGDVVWMVQAADVASPGSGSCELTYTVDGVVAKSQTWSTYVAASISGDAPGEPPEEPAKAWFAAIQAQIGNLDDLTTKAKENLVAAINEAAKTGSGGAGSISMRTADGYIQYSTDGGKSWENLIALAELKGEPGQDGYSPTAQVEATADGAKITITDKDGITEATVKNGKDGADGAPGKDGADGAPGKDGTDGTNGITPTIGDNGNWYLGNTDTGKPSRGPAGQDGAPGAKGDPGKDGAGMDVTGASAGQIARISAVDADGKPTAWEPADLPGGGENEWEQIVDLTTSEDTNAIQITEGLSQFTKLWIELYTFSSEASQMMVSANGANSSTYTLARIPYRAKGGRAFAGYIETLPNGWTGGAGMFRFLNNGSDENAPIPTRGLDGVWSEVSFVQTDNNSSKFPIISLRAAVNQGVMKAGTRLFIYGRKA